MKNVNTILLQKIYDLISPVVNCPVYYKYLPATIASNIYVSLNTVSQTDVSTMQSSDTDASVIVGIYSKERQGNPGELLNDVASAVYAAIYPNQQTVLDLSPGFQNTSIELVNDIEQDALQANNFIFINRFLTFRFNIFHFPGAATTTTLRIVSQGNANPAQFNFYMAGDPAAGDIVNFNYQLNTTPAGLHIPYFISSTVEAGWNTLDIQTDLYNKGNVFTPGRIFQTTDGGGNYGIIVLGEDFASGIVTIIHT